MSLAASHYRETDKRDVILKLLREEDEERLTKLWLLADEVRLRSVGSQVHLRGLIEFSNVCGRGCAYCGLRVGNKRLTRYRMSRKEVLDCVKAAHAFGYGTVVLQSGEDEEMSAWWLADVIQAIKDDYPLAVTLCFLAGHVIRRLPLVRSVL